MEKGNERMRKEWRKGKTRMRREWRRERKE